MSAGPSGGAKGSWSPLVTEDGSLTLVHGGHGEACHSRAGAWLEAWERYVLACRVPETLESGDARGRLRLLDVGTGLGWNIAALLRARELHAPRTSLEVVTLEIDGDVIRAAIELAAAGQGDERLASLREVHRALGRALDLDGEGWVPLGAGDRLRLCLGDGRCSLPALDPELRFDLVFLDPFSPKSDPSLWEGGFLREIARRMAPGSWLSTYSAASGVRAGLAAAGLRVGPGPRVGQKSQGTVASPDRDLPLFAPRIARRIARQARVLAQEWPSEVGERKNPPGPCSTGPGVGLE